MNMKKISGIVAAVTLAFGITAPAHAGVELVAGDLKITFNAYDAGTINYPGTNNVHCTSVASCDAVPGIRKAPNAVGSEDTWGIFSVASITTLSTGENIYVSGQNGTYLTGIFGGIADTFVEGFTGNSGQTTRALGTGGWLRMYENSTNYNASFGPGARQGQFGYTGITDGSLYLSAVFGAGVYGGLPQYTYLSEFTTNSYGGRSEGFLDVVGGSAAAQFDTNLQVDPNQGRHDLYLQTTFRPTINPNDPARWTVIAAGQADGAIGEVPEPGSLALLGLGFAGLAGLRRRRAAK